MQRYVCHFCEDEFVADPDDAPVECDNCRSSAYVTEVNVQLELHAWEWRAFALAKAASLPHVDAPPA